ncbi:MAG: SusF/SusE family outer membrane protein [Chitinophagaceae bacterium]|nr:MAG: SusF/SusE family outer membrane protein [Chitinophagaceae bacterium]
MMKKLIYLLVASAMMLNACKKTDFAGDDPTGEGLTGFNLRTPATSANVVLNAATPEQTINFSWSAATPGLTTAPTYKIVMAPRTGGNLSTPLLEFDAQGNTSLALSYSAIDAALAAKGIAAGAVADLNWSVVATNGDKTVMASGIFILTVRRFSDGAAPFQVLAPASTLTAQSINPASTADKFEFRWTKSKVATGGPAIHYKVLFAERKVDGAGNPVAIDWNSPLFSVDADNTGLDSLATITYKQMSDLLSAAGFTNLPLPVSLTWTVVASTGNWKQYSDFTNNIVLTREIKMYIVGSATPNGWDASQAVRMIADGSNFGVFYMYVYLVGGQEMKFLNGQAFPPAAGAVDWGMGGAAGDLTADGESNIPVATSGVYRITADLNNMKYYLQQGRMATVGGATDAGWNPPGVFPSQELGFVGTNLFLGVSNFKGGDEFKMIDSDSWPGGGGPVNQTRDYGRGATEGVLAENNESNFTGPAAGLNRVIWDGSDPLNLKYQVITATEMRIVGNGMQAVPDWNPGASPQMTYSGNGVWTLTLALKANAEIKFLAGNDWGAFDYEDASGGSQATGVARKIQWTGGDNFKTPAVAGTYTVTLNEKAQTVTFTP